MRLIEQIHSQEGKSPSDYNLKVSNQIRFFYIEYKLNIVK